MIQRYFGLSAAGSTVRQEVVGGATTFAAMAYIVIVNPKILEAAGMPFGPAMVATVLSAFFGTLLMGLYANRPFAVAPYMGENAFIAYTVVGVLGYTWQTALGAILIGGVLFTLLTVTGGRRWLARAIPEHLKIAFAVGIGLFLTFIGLVESGLVRLGVEAAPVHIGRMTEAGPLLALLGFGLIAVLMIRRVQGAILLGILAVSGLAGLVQLIRPETGLVVLPDRWVSLPPDISPVLFQVDLVGALTWGFFSVILTVFVMDFVDTMGSLIGLSFRANLLDERGELPEIEKPMLCDAVATTAGALLGTTTCGVYIESAAGIESGARTGLAAVVTAGLFLGALFFAPAIGAVPAFAYGPALIVVGMLMLEPIRRLRFDDLTQVVPAFTTIVLMCFTYNLGIGLTAGLLADPLVQIAAGRPGRVTVGGWVLGGLSLLFYLFYPYS